MRWRASTPRCVRAGDGSGCSLRQRWRPTPVWSHPQASPVPRAVAEGDQGRRREGEHSQASICTHATPQLRDASASGWHRHPNGPGTPGPQRCQHDHDLHARAQGRRRQDRESVGLSRLTGGCPLLGRKQPSGHVQLPPGCIRTQPSAPRVMMIGMASYAAPRLLA